MLCSSVLLLVERFIVAFRTARLSHVSKASSVHSVARQVGGPAWNPLGAYENAFLAYLDDFCDYTRGLAFLLGDWYHNKWSLYLRGFSRGVARICRSSSTMRWSIPTTSGS